ncbi:hypothetical protein HIV01_012750 [Lysobacter arenosi]|uniref:Uncharacterized protein n=1 Tax=Lysobacter arenosi TaxID=2795387 RepID=A0ABX7R7I1_9GAMM|nr:hypothetical protein [Lysobacter arenosi]QSX74078.1 hypothetical protein HIV01_012750 [Lysobacter arenosi]
MAVPLGDAFSVGAVVAGAAGMPRRQSRRSSAQVVEGRAEVDVHRRAADDQRGYGFHAGPSGFVDTVR